MTFSDKHVYLLLRWSLIVSTPNQEHQAEGGTSERGSDLDVSAAYPKVLSQGAADPNHQRKKIRKEKRCSKGYKRVYLHRLGDKGKSMSAYLNDLRRQSYHSSRRDTKSCYQSSRSRGTEPTSEKHHNKIASSHKTQALSESEGSAGGHWKSMSKKQRSSIDDDDLSQPWAKETMFPFLSRMAMDILSVQATSVASESAFSSKRKQDKSTLKTLLDFTEEILDAEVQENKAILLSDEEIALDAASSEGSMFGPDSGGEEAEAEEGCPPVRQKRISQAVDKNQAIQEEIRKLVDAGIMKEVHYYSWLSNPVMVKKHDDSCRICVDFKDLKKACPKDGYPLPKIDWKQARNEHVNAVFTRSVKSYNPPVNPNDQQENSEIPVNFYSDDEDDEPTPQQKTQNSKPAKETPLPKPYKPKILYPQCLRKEKMEAQYRKFLNMIRVVRINIPLIDVLTGMPNYGKFLKELISSKRKIKQISVAFLSDESSAMIQNKVLPKLEDPGSFLILCNFNKTFSCNALAVLGASINLMSYLLYAKLSLETLKPTKMSVRLADRSFQYPVRIAENMLVEVGKFTFLADFVILEMEEDSKVPLILGRLFLHTADAVNRVKQKQLNLGVGTERMIFNINSMMKHSYSNDETCFRIDVTDEIFEEDFNALLDEGSKILHSIKGTLFEEEIFAEFDEFMALTADENSDSEFDTEEPPFKKITINTNYKIKTSLKEPFTDLELKPLPDNLVYVFLEEPSFLRVIITSQLSKEKNKLISVLKKHKQAFAWKTTDISGICPSFCKHKIQLLDDKKPVVQKQRRLNPNMQEVVKK
nr:reverse transcriptase domain-containing protein [Tanacetum cinerariifolium]